MVKAYETLEVVENDVKEAIQLARDLKKGLLLESITKEHKLKMCNQIIEALER